MSLYGTSDPTEEARLVAVLNSRNSDPEHKCPECGHYASFTNRPWCVNVGYNGDDLDGRGKRPPCKWFDQEERDAWLARGEEEKRFVPEVQPGDSGSWPAPSPAPKTKVVSRPVGAALASWSEPWPIHDPTPVKDYTRHWADFMDKLDEWASGLILFAPLLTKGLVRIEVPMAGIPLKSPPFAPGAGFQILCTLQKRKEYTPPLVARLPGSLKTPGFNIDVFVEPNLPCDKIRLSVGDYCKRNDPQWGMDIDLTSPHKASITSKP